MQKFLFVIVMLLFQGKLTAFATNKNTPTYTYASVSDSIKYWNYTNNRVISYKSDTPISDLEQLKKGIVFLKNKKHIQAGNQFVNLIKKEGYTKPIIKAFAYWQMSFISSDSICLENFTAPMEHADSIFNATLNEDDLLLYYRDLVNYNNQTTLQTLPLKVIENALQLTLKNKDWQTHTKYLHKMTAYYRNLGDYYHALKYHNQSLEFCKKYNFETLERKYLLWSYEIYEYTGDTLRIKRDLTRALALNKKYNDSLGLADSYNNLGRYYSLIKNYSEAIANYLQASQINVSLDNSYFLAINYLNIGEAYLYTANYPLAETFYKKAIERNKRIDFVIGNGFAYAGMIKVAWMQNEMSNAAAYVDSAKHAAFICNYHRVNKYLYQILIEYYFQQNQKDSCIAYQFKLNTLTDSIDSADIHKRMQWYETHIKEKEIALLSSEQNLLRTRQQKTRQQLIWLTVTFLLVFTALLFIMKLYFNKEKAFALLVEKNMSLIKLNDSSTKNCNGKSAETDPKDIALASAFVKLLHAGSYSRDKDVTLETFADLLNTNRAYLSKAINQCLHKNFSAIINQYRIQEACKMLVNPKYNYLSIEGIAATVGFSSKTSFNRVFKAETGITPSDFRNNQIDSQQIATSN